jgi:hypothetical protein
VTTPNYSASTPSVSGTQGNISGLGGDDQATVLAHLQDQQYGSGAPSWWSGLQGFGSKVWGAINGLGSIIAGVGGTIATDVSDTILTVGHTLNSLGTALATAAETVIGDISHVVADGENALQDLWNALGSGLGGASSGHTAATLNAQAIAVALTGQNAEAAAIAIQNQLSSGTSGTGTGLDVSLTFTGADGAALSGTDWFATGPSSGDVVVRLGANSTPSMGIAAGQPVGVYSATSAYSYSTDDQTFECVLGAGGGHTELVTYLLFHSNSSFTAGGYLALSTNSVALGSYTQSGGTYTFASPLGTMTGYVVSAASRVEVHNVGNIYSITLNGGEHPSITDTGNTIPQGSSYRSAQVLMTRASVTINPGPFQYPKVDDSLQLAGVLLSDYSIPTVLGNGFQVEMLSATSSSSLSSSESLSSFFTSTSYITNAGGWSTTNGYTVPTTGWWVFQLMVNAANKAGGATTWTEFQGGLVSSNVSGYAAVGAVWASTIASNDPFILYCHAGDVIAPYCCNSSGAHMGSGWFSGVLMSP